MFTRLVTSAFVMLAAACATTPAPSTLPPLTAPQTITLAGTVTRDDYPSYLELPFDVPPGVKRLTLTYDHTAKGDGVTLDLGLRDPDGQRGWSGSNKTGLVLSAWEATPSFRAGPIIPGEWIVILGVPAVREGKTSDYTVTIELDNELTIADFPARPFETGASSGYLRGDFHTHTGHSDGSCGPADGERMPCPTLATVSAATSASLDFVAITDHNTLSQLADLRGLLGGPEITLIPGSEITTFRGHANVFGLLEPLDFQLGTDRLPDLDVLLDDVDSRGALLSVNHPGLPTGERCMGCGWDADTDWSRIEAIEVVNGGLFREGAEEGEYSGIAFWERLLDQGHRITAIGASDNHDPLDQTGAQSPIGVVTTQVYAADRSVRGILDGVRSGRAVVDLMAGREVDLRFQQGGREIFMGGEIRLAEGETLEGALVIGGSPLAAEVEIISSGVDATALLADEEPTAVPATAVVTVTGQGKAGWFRFNLRDPNTGRLTSVGNPIYVVPAD